MRHWLNEKFSTLSIRAAYTEAQMRCKRASRSAHAHVFFQRSGDTVRSDQKSLGSRAPAFALLYLIVIFCIPLALHAAEQQSAELSIEPVVIDETAQARDILKESITLVNTSNRKLTLYPSVNNVSAEDGKQEFVNATDSSDRAASLANWIELSRGVVELGPGEEKVIPFVIRVNMNAIAGSYHARISFGDGSSRSAAESGPPLAFLMVNVEVKANVKEVMQLNKFFTDSFYFSGDDVLFNYQLENIGNQELSPRGEIRIYNRKGEEVAAVGINGEGKSYAPDQVAQLASVWSAVDGFGRYKAFLTVDYGRGQGASVQDTIYFWIVPWKQLLTLFIVSMIAIIFFALYFHKWFEDRHLGKLALAGFLKHQPHEISAIVDAHTPGITSRLAAFASLAATPFTFIGDMIPRVSFSRRAAPPAVQSVAAPVPPPATAPKPATRSLRDAFESDAAPRVNTPRNTESPIVDRRGTIDLKKLHQQRANPEHTDSHVINLKRR